MNTFIFDENCLFIFYKSAVRLRYQFKNNIIYLLYKKKIHIFRKFFEMYNAIFEKN